MKYFKRYKEPDAQAKEITKEEAKRTLESYWVKEAIDDTFDNNREFRLYTPYSEVWTETDEGMVPMPGFYGIVG